MFILFGSSFQKLPERIKLMDIGVRKLAAMYPLEKLKFNMASVRCWIIFFGSVFSGSLFTWKMLVGLFMIVSFIWLKNFASFLLPFESFLTNEAICFLLFGFWGSAMGISSASLNLLSVIACMVLRQWLSALFVDVVLGCLLALLEAEWNSVSLFVALFLSIQSKFLRKLSGELWVDTTSHL